MFTVPKGAQRKLKLLHMPSKGQRGLRKFGPFIPSPGPLFLGMKVKFNIKFLKFDISLTGIEITVVGQ